MARSGEFRTRFHPSYSNSGSGYYLTIVWSQSDPFSQEAIATNTTTLTAELWIGGRGSGYHIISSRSRTCGIVVDSNDYTGTAVVAFPESKEGEYKATLLLTKTFTIYHEEDGSAKVNIRGYTGAKTSSFDGTAYIPGSSSANTVELVLDSIPKFSEASISESTSMEIGKQVTINIERNIDSLTHMLFYSFNGEDWHSINNEPIETSYVWDLTEEIAKNFTNVSSTLIYIKTDTYDSSKKIGSTQFSTSIYITEETGRPKINSLNISQTNSGNLDYYILNKSKVSAYVTSETYGGASIKYFVYSINDSLSYNILPSGENLNEGLYSFVLKNNLGSIVENLYLKISIYAIDSRGFSSTALSSEEIPVLSYYNPIIKNTKLIRGRIVDYNFEEYPSGNRIKINFSYDINPLSIENENEEIINLNTKKISFKYSINDGSVSTPVEQELELFQSDLEMGYDYIPDLILDTNSQYKIYLTIQDALSSSTEILSIRSQGVLLNFGSNGYSAAIGGKAVDNRFTIFYPTLFQEGIEYKEIITNDITISVDLNNLLPGWYSFVQTPEDTMDKNHHFPLTPSEVNNLGLIDEGVIEVSGISNSEMNWTIQKITYLSSEGNKICFFRSFTGVWSDWQTENQVIEDDDTEIEYSRIIAPNSENGSIMITNESGSFDLTGMDSYLNDYISDTSNTFLETRFKNYLDSAFKTYVLDIIYPIGSIYISTSEDENKKPSVLFGGTWEQIEDRFLLAAGSTYLGGETGGKESHKHIAPIGYESTSKYLGTLNINGNTTTFDSVGGYNTVMRDAGGSTIPSGVAAYYTQTVSNMPPYLVVYIWKRIA